MRRSTRSAGASPGAARDGGAGSSESGSATVLAVAFAGVLVFVALGLAGAVGVVVDHRRAQAAADLAALAGAAAAEPCSAAGRIAAANGARLVACRPEGVEVVVTVSVRSRAWAGRIVRITADARAGPG